MMAIRYIFLKPVTIDVFSISIDFLISKIVKKVPNMRRILF